jgi:hypothetical protein
LLAAVGVATIAGGMAWRWRPVAPAPDPGPPAVPTPRDPRVAYQGPYHNVRPDVEYVGDAACARCHVKIAKDYQQSAMGRSMRPIAEVAPLQRYGADANNPFEALGYQFFVERRGDGVWQHQSRKGPDGAVLLDFSLEVQYAIGSGTRGYSYVTDRAGYLFQTGVSWFSQKGSRGGWDKSPGFLEDRLSGRPLITACLYCHANHAQALEGTENHYDRPFAAGIAIGCERCHGPGALHVQQGGGEPVGGINPTIVNPRRLDHPLREAVCQQCHLEGEVRVLRRGRKFDEFRPGLPLESVLAVFTHADDSGEKAVTHVEQMYLSRCFAKSAGEQKLGCVSCHDPHRRVTEAERIGYYRQGCLACHTEHACTAPAPSRAAVKDSCTDCHMPRFQSSDIAHTAGTDHRIIRPGKAPPLSGGDDDRLKPFLPAGDPKKDKELSRDLGIALLQSAFAHSGRRDAGMKLGAQACLDFPDDLDALGPYGTALMMLGNPKRSAAVFDQMLARSPGHEAALVGAGTARAALNQTDAAIDAWQRAVIVNPWMPTYRGELAGLLAKKGDWKEALTQAEVWLRLSPFWLEARKAWIAALAHNGRHDEARAELDRARALHPLNQGELVTWFGQLR